MIHPAVWSLAWHRDGHIADASLEVLGEARRVADLLETEAVAVWLGETNPEAIETLGAFGAHRVLATTAPQLNRFATAPATAALAALIDAGAPRLVLVPETADGCDIAPRLATRLGLSLVPDCSFLRVGAAGELVATRPAWNGKIAERVTVGPSGLVMIAAGVFPPHSEAGAALPEVEQVTVAGLPEPEGDLISSKRLEPDDLTLEEAEVIVAGGMGMGGADGFRSLEKLAAVLGAKVAASRRATDLGWVEREALVGQTGKTVRPAVYFACGISGASQHILGMRESQLIVAVNSDPTAPIFGIADLGVVGDATTVIPELTDAFQRKLDEEAGT